MISDFESGVNKLPVSVDDNTLVFETEQGFLKCIDFLNQSDGKQLDDFERILNYRSLRTTNNSTEKLCEDELFLTMLNPDKQVIINNYLFKVDFNKERTYLFPIDTERGTLKSSNTKLNFSWDDDIFEVLESGSLGGLKSGYCTTKREKYKGWEFNKGMPDFYERLKAKVCFQRFGFYNSIIIKFKADDFNLMSPLINGNYHTVGNNYYRRKKDKANISFSRQNSTVFKGKGNEIHHRPYQSTRRLKAYFVSVKFSWFYTDYGGYHSDDKTLTISCP